MYSVNGIDLSTAEYRVLKCMYDGKPAPDDIDLDSMYDIEANLYQHKLINGWKIPGNVHYGGISEIGKSFIEDYEKSQKAEKEAERRGNWHDYKVAAISAIVGYLLGAFGDDAVRVIGRLLETLSR